jgi:hypothetical protein
MPKRKTPRGSARKQRRAVELVKAGVYTPKALHGAFHPESTTKPGYALINSDGSSRLVNRRLEPRAPLSKCRVCGGPAIHGDDVCKNHIPE